MNKLKCAAAIFLSWASCVCAQQLSIPTMASGDHETLCKDEWTKRGVLDRAMFRYCLGLQSEGYKDVVDLARKNSAQPWIQSVLDSAIEQWSKRGSRNDAMVAYELKNQIESYLDSVYVSKQKNFNAEAFDQCKEEWTKSAPNWSMTMYCYKQKTE